MKAIYDTNQHSVFLLQYHLIFVVKYRREVIDDTICARLRQIFEYIAKSPRYALQIIEFNHDIDHLHILFKAQPKSELVAFINAYKSASSRLIKKEFPHLRKYLWKEYFWSRSYFLATTGGVTLEVLKKYVENQGIEDNRPKKQYLTKKKKALMEQVNANH
ncbi:IS200/IS605 family transposase [Campylobacter coli]|uniref:IS200/IS605 family transposase n=1 Tax=Campylobacter coli TaxID=195 RepID=UPI0012C4EEA2|nr:IS200/IS605 family transposase [Campylobacter coli]ECK7776573.1 IS200/IS605 family transposase [Campylobacter coli]EDO6882881.1 IS200/IS605 family transposase [Campylobacter coli]MBX2493094.1 IS200/IS605 family transposase [Campylobacter coli]HEF2632755.1 IS200/IS605 family transposase [Campylobacter coli]